MLNEHEFEFINVSCNDDMSVFSVETIKCRHQQIKN